MISKLLHEHTRIWNVHQKERKIRDIKTLKQWNVSSAKKGMHKKNGINSMIKRKFIDS